MSAKHRVLVTVYGEFARSVAGLLLLFCLGLGGVARAAVFDSHAIQSEVLENGLRVIVKEEESASTVSVQLAVRVGVADEPEQQGGIAHLLEHVLWAGNAQDPRGEVEAGGGVTNAGTLRDFTRFYAVTSAEEWKTALQARR